MDEIFGKYNVLEIPDIVGMDPDPRAALDAIFGLLRHGFWPAQ
jgi:hypothetical protein